MRLTLADVARAAGVSTATVDRVLHSRDGVRAPTRTRVLGAARRLGYIEPEATPAAAPTAATPVPLAFIIPGGTNTFFGMLSRELEEIARARRAELDLAVHRLAAFHPEALAEGIVALARTARGLGVIAVDHPAVREAIRLVVARGAKVLTLVSDISDVPSIGYVGINNRAAGRLAGYITGRLAAGRAGPVALLMGSASYRGHEEREMGFRRILADEFPALSVLLPRESHDDSETSYRLVRQLLEDEPSLVGLYNTGAGSRGVARALEEAGRARSTVFIGHELTEHTRRFLLAGTMDMAIDQNPRAEVELAVTHLVQAVTTEQPLPPIPMVRLQAIFRENMPEL